MMERFFHVSHEMYVMAAAISTDESVRSADSKGGQRREAQATAAEKVGAAARYVHAERAQ